MPMFLSMIGRDFEEEFGSRVMFEGASKYKGGGVTTCRTIIFEGGLSAILLGSGE